MMTNQLNTATFAGGCFWCLEAVFKEIPGVINVTSGYMGGHIAHPTYHEVCTGNTGHAEVVQIIFDENHLSYPFLLQIFFAIHDPTTLNQQGHDMGTQYRSAIFYHSVEQAKAAHAAITALTLSQQWGKAPIVTEVRSAENFYPAEDYHQDYFALHKAEPYCQAIIAPKVKKAQLILQENWDNQ
jgi:peptide-methionine (S)-S-oxide reductase